MTKQSDSFPSSDFWKQCARPCAGAGLNRLRAIWKGAEQVMQVIHPEKASRGPAPAQGRSPQARPSASRHHTLLAPPPLCAGAWPAAGPSSGHSTHRARDCCSRATRRSLASPAAAQPAHTLVACCSVQKHVRPHAALQSSSHFHRQPVTSSLLLVYTVRLLTTQTFVCFAKAVQFGSTSVSEDIAGSWDSAGPAQLRRPASAVLVGA